MIKKLKKLIALDNPFRLQYHKIRAILANVINGFPSKDMIIVGVTGTNGKTTTCNIIAKGLIESGKKVFMFTTVNIIIDGEEYVNNSKMTSPDPFELQRLLKIAKSKGCEVAVIETASHGIKMHRIWGINYDIVVLTNITQDHLDLHRTMDDYVHTKLEIFKNLMYYKRKKGIKKVAVVNRDSEYSELFLGETYDSLYTYGNDGASSLKPKNISNTFEGIKFNVSIAGPDIEITSPLKGDFNVYNILAAIGVFISFGIKAGDIPKIVQSITGIPGRMEEVKNIENFKVYIDYAHTEDALEKVLTSLKSTPGVSNIITVFGATGDRDKSKRPAMGEVVSRLSDKVILTQDDDYSENTEEIIKDVLPGINRAEGDNFWIIPDRREAIRTALVSAKKNDIVLIAGKGDEHSLVTNNGPVEWHDKTVVLEILKGIDDNKIIK